MWFVSQWVQEHLEAFRAVAASKVTTMGHIQRGHLKEAMVTCPPDGILERFGSVMEPILEKTIQNQLESQVLVRVRDTLLPKLISGEVRVKQVEVETS